MWLEGQCLSAILRENPFLETELPRGAETWEQSQGAREAQREETKGRARQEELKGTAGGSAPAGKCREKASPALHSWIGDSSIASDPGLGKLQASPGLVFLGGQESTAG